MRRPGRPPRIQPHPYAATPAELIALLPPIAASTPTGAATLLPCPRAAAGRSARPSSSVTRSMRAPGRVRPGSWQVPVLELDADLAFATLPALDPDAAAWGASVNHLVELAGFAADLVGRGRILPLVLTNPPRAVWRPVLTGPDAAFTRVLAVLDAAAGGGRRPRPRPRRLVRCPRHPGRRGGAARSRLGPAQHRPRRGPGGTGLAGRADRRRPYVPRRPRRLARLASMARALAGRRRRRGRCGPASGSSSRPADDRRLAGPVRAAGRRRAEPGGRRRRGLAVPRRAARRWPGRSTLRRRRSWPSWARPAGCTRSSTTPCAPPGRLELGSTPTARTGSSAAAPTLATAGFGVLLPGWWSRAARPGSGSADRELARPRPGTVATAERRRPRLHRRLPLGARARRRAC